MVENKVEYKDGDEETSAAEPLGRMPSQVVELRTLEIFYWVVRLKSFSKAAVRLHTTQPAVSARIAHLEEVFGVRLLERLRRSPVALTLKGRQLFSYAERMLQLNDEMFSGMSAGAMLEGTIRLGVAETILSTWLPDLIKILHEKHPGVMLDISIDVSSPNLASQLSRGEIDLAFHLGPLETSQVVNVDLHAWPLAWVASPLLKSSSATELMDIAKSPVMTFSRGTKVHEDIKALLARSGVRAPQLFTSTSLASLITMAIDGIGVSVVPMMTVLDHLQDGRLKLLRLEEEIPPLNFTASYIEGPNNVMAATLAHIAQDTAAAYSERMTDRLLAASAYPGGR